MGTLTLNLMFRNDAEEAAGFYVTIFSSVFGNFRILKKTFYGEEEPAALRQVPEVSGEIMPGPAGSVKTIRFELNGMEIVTMNGGGFFGMFTESTSLHVSCGTRELIDMLWTALSRGGVELPCGWLKDRFGVSWQIAPSIIQEIMEGPDMQKFQRVMLALYPMKKIDLQEILRVAGIHPSR